MPPRVGGGGAIAEAGSSSVAREPSDEAVGGRSSVETSIRRSRGRRQRLRGQLVEGAAKPRRSSRQLLRVAPGRRALPANGVAPARVADGARSPSRLARAAASPTCERSARGRRRRAAPPRAPSGPPARANGGGEASTRRGCARRHARRGAATSANDGRPRARRRRRRASPWRQRGARSSVARRAARGRTWMRRLHRQALGEQLVGEREAPAAAAAAPPRAPVARGKRRRPN